jgi:hypothetical protein
MDESIRRTLIGTKVAEIDILESTITFYLLNEHGACYTVQIESSESSIAFFGTDENQ